VKDERLQLRVGSKLKRDAERLARRRNTTLTALITAYLQELVDTESLQRSGRELVEQV
jgi:hypothetical protein